MPDLVVTVPKKLWLEWIAEGDTAGDPWTGGHWDFSVSTRPRIEAGERVYVVSHGRLRGYAPLVSAQKADGSWARWVLTRAGGAVAVTIPEEIPGFRGFRYRWWGRGLERPFPEWKTP